MLPWIVIISVGFALLLGYLTRDITFFGTDTDNEKQADAAGSWRQWSWLSDMHRHGQNKTLMKDVIILLLVVSQKLCGVVRSDKPLVYLCIASNAVSAILVFLIASILWGPLTGALLFVLFIGSFWSHQVALFGGHICVAQMLSLFSCYAALRGHYAAHAGAVFWFASAGITSAATFFASSSARKYLPFNLFILLWAVLGLSWSSQSIVVFHQICLVVACCLALLLAAKLVCYEKFKSIALTSGTYLGRKIFVPSGGSLTEVFNKQYLQMTMGVAIFLSLSLLALVLSLPSIISLLAYVAGATIVFFSLLYPNFSDNISRYFYYWNIGKHACHFILYREHFAKMGMPIADDMRGAGIPWLIKFFRLFIPGHCLLAILSVVALVMVVPITSVQTSLVSLFVLALCISPIAWAEITAAPQLTRSYIPGLFGILFLIGYTQEVIEGTLPQYAPLGVMVQWFIALISTAHGMWVYFDDVLPARMAPAWALRKLKKLGASKFYTYKNAYNNGFAEVIHSNLERNTIESIRDVSHGYILVPGTSSKALNMESEPWGIKYGDFTLDLALNNLLDSKKIQDAAVASFKTFGTSKIWVHESEASSFRALITNEIGEKDFWRGRAWILDAAKVKRCLYGEVMSNPNVNKEMLVTILVPSLNRSPFLIRLMRYYHSVGFKGALCIADSSVPEDFAKTAAEVARLKGQLNVIHLSMPGKHAGACLKEMAQYCSTPYVAFIGDDDIFVPSGLAQCVEFLEQHPDYVAAHGESVSITLDRSGPYGSPVAAVFYPQPQSEHPDPIQRLAQLMSNYGVTLFSVHRIEAWREMFQDSDKVTDKAFREEFLPCLMTLILGKVASLPGLYLVRQHHDARYMLPGTFDWMAKKDWAESFQKTTSSLAQALCKRVGCSEQDALQIVKQCFGIYISIALAAECLKITINKPNDAGQKHCDLNTVLSPQGEFYQLFIPVRQALQEQAI